MNQKTAPQHSRTQDNYRDMGVLTARRQHPKDEGAWRREWPPSMRETHHKSPACPKNQPPHDTGNVRQCGRCPSWQKLQKPRVTCTPGTKGGTGKYGVPCQGRCWFPSILYCTGARLSSRKQKEASMHASSILNCNSREQFWHTGPL